MNELQYVKRPGTSGVHGQLYETKLISLILFRALHDDDIEEFYIGTNVDGLGDFDDICFRFKVKGFDKPVAVFIQAKHRDCLNKVFAANSIDYTEYFDSYMKIRNKFDVNSSNEFFKVAYDDIEYVFVLYTNSKDHFNKKKGEKNTWKNIHANLINKTISTGDDAFQLPSTYKDTSKGIFSRNIKKLGAVVSSIVRNKGENYENLLNVELLHTYHVILGQKVFNIDDVKSEGYRLGEFKTDFFDTNDEHLLALKDSLLEENNLNELRIAKFKLPLAFGNSDMTLRQSKEEKRLTRLSKIIVDLLTDSQESVTNGETYNIVNIHDNFSDKGFLKTNGGIAGAVGNLLVLDETTNLLKFSEISNLKGHSKTLFEKINSEQLERKLDTVLENYRFDVDVKNFPELSFNCNKHDRDLVVHFANRLLFYTNQATESEVESNLIEEIFQIQSSIKKCNFQIVSDVIFQIYHNEIQKWWMKQEDAYYLTKTTQLYHNATSNTNIITNYLLSIANVWSEYRFQTEYIKFDLKIVNTLQFDQSCSKMTIIDSEDVALSVIKVTQFFTDNNYVLIDLNYILSLPANEYRQLKHEMKEVKDKIFILTCKGLYQVSKLNKGIKDILRTLEGNRLIIVTNNESVEEIRNISADNGIDIIYDTCSLLYLTKESQDFIFGKTNVIFQGQEVSLNELFKDDDFDFFKTIKRFQINKIMNEESILLGEPLTDSRYEQMKQFYVSRKITKKQSTGALIHLESFYDVEDHVVVIAAKPGKGKSCLLTHLSLSTKARNPEVWIVRINLLDHSKMFYQWKENKVVINVLEALRFICIVLFIHKVEYTINLNGKNGEIFLEDCTNLSEEAIFEITIFLHFCNRRKVIFIFDGFDEICPNYEKEVKTVLKILKDYRPREHLIWITTRTYNETLSSLEQEFTDFYQFEPWSITDLEIFFKKFLHLKFNLDELTPKQIDKINDFMIFTAQCSYVPTGPVSTVYYFAALYFKNKIRQVSDTFKDKEKYIREWDLSVETMTELLNVCEVIKTPLLVYIAADYFQSEIKYFENNTVWNLKVNTLMMFEHFVETKFRIRFEEKNKMDPYNPDIEPQFRRQRNEFLNKHKRLGAFATFNEDFRELFNEVDLKDILETINSIKLGKEKTGLMDSGVNGRVNFIHMTFAEYFAVEYICDLLKSARSNDEFSIMWKLLSTYNRNYKYVDTLCMFDIKLETDDELRRVLYEERSRRIILEHLLDVCPDPSSDNTINTPNPFYIHPSLNLHNLNMSSLEFIDPSNELQVSKARYLIRELTLASIACKIVSETNHNYHCFAC